MALEDDLVDFCGKYFINAYQYYNTLIINIFSIYIMLEINIPLAEISDVAQSQKLDGNHTDFHRKRA